MSHILLATDGSEHAMEAAKRAIDLAADGDRPLYVLSVVDRRKFDEPALSTEELATIEAENHSSEFVSDVVALAQQAGVLVDSETRHGVPHEEILDCAADLGVECIVVGAHGEHAEHFGGVGRHVLDEADCEVLVVGTRT